MATHSAVVTLGPGVPLAIHQVPTIKPVGNQVRVRNEWTASTPLDLHQADGGLLVNLPQVLGDGVAGTIVEIGPDVTNFKVGDKVFGFTWRNQTEKAHQEYLTTTENVLGKLPAGVSMQAAVTLPNNFVTAWHTFTCDFGLELPWPKPAGYVPAGENVPILIWGGSSSVGQFGLQILKWYGYRNLITTASKAHHSKLQKYGAKHCFDYRDSDVEDGISRVMKSLDPTESEKHVSYILDCIGSLEGSVRPVSRIASSGAKVAVLLPVIVKDAAEGVKPEYTMETENVVPWNEGVEVVGVRTHFYLNNPLLAEKLQPEIMPKLLGEGIIEPNDQVIVEGNTLLERAENALRLLRNKQVSGARLVWKIAD